MPALTEPSDDTVTENDFSTPAARRILSVHVAFGATWKSARRTMLPMRAPNSSFFVTSAVTVTQPAARARLSNAPSSTVLPTPRRPVMSIDCSAYPRTSRSSRISKPSSSASRPTSAGGGAPAFGVYGLSRGFTARL